MRAGKRKTIEVKLGERPATAGAVSFQAPLFLLGLPLVALLAVAYAARQAGGAERAAAWASPRMVPSVDRAARVAAPRPDGAVGLALAVLVVALARPQASVAVEVERAPSCS